MEKKFSEKYYKENSKYSNFLDHQDKGDFKKYVEKIASLSNKKSKFLDVGCGTGIALELLKNKIIGYGVEVSNTSIKKCKEKNLNCEFYNGKKLPFGNQEFDIVGSFNVLEHTDDPPSFLNEQNRVLKQSGYLIIVCPNFLSITNNYHQHTKGLTQKLSNIKSIFKKAVGQGFEFEKMATTDREEFRPDDDACNVTNPVDIIRWAKQNKFKMIYWSGRATRSPGIIKYLDRFPFKSLLGSSFLIFKKI